MMKNNFKNQVRIFILASVLFFTAKMNSQVVLPVQSGHYLVNFANIRDLALPPPGFFIMLYNYNAFSNTYVDKHGVKYKSLNPSNLDPTFPDENVDLHLNTFSTAPAFYWASKPNFIGGATYMFGVIPSFVSASATFKNENVENPFVSELKISGFGDLFVSPFSLIWGFNQFDVTFSYGFTAPTGKFNIEEDDNVGMGFWSNQFQGYGYYYTSEDRSTALMLGLTYEINGNIKGVDAKIGDRLSLEWGISQYLSEKIEIGIQGGSTWQISDDKGADILYDPSYHDKMNTIGALFSYWPWNERLNLVLKYNRDFGVRQGFVNNAIMLNAIFITNALK